jgi:hypothetical protein
MKNEEWNLKFEKWKIKLKNEKRKNIKNNWNIKRKKKTITEKFLVFFIRFSFSIFYPPLLIFYCPLSNFHFSFLIFFTSFVFDFSSCFWVLTEKNKIFVKSIRGFVNYNSNTVHIRIFSILLVNYIVFFVFLKSIRVFEYFVYSNIFVN